MDLDFQLFQLKLLYSLTPHVPLRDNLRAVFAPTLGKLKRYCRANVAIHVFENPELGEIHALVVGSSHSTLRALGEELSRRHEPFNNLIPHKELPDYLGLIWPPDRETVGQRVRRIFKAERSESMPQLSGQLLQLLQRLADSCPAEFDAQRPRQGDNVIVIPLGTLKYPRLGHFVLWSPRDALREAFEHAKKREGRIAFKRWVEELVIHVFTNYYSMEPRTYLPSYHRTETKTATLVCAEIANFHRLSAVLPKYTHHPKWSECLRNLVNLFVGGACSIVEKHQGRVDQIWGNGILAVFGEYLDTPTPTPAPGCKRALTAAAEFVESFEKDAEQWLRDDFRYDLYKRSYIEHVTVRPTVAIHHGEVIFDYLGSAKRQVYTTVGEHVDFVKQLTALAARNGLDSVASTDQSTSSWLDDSSGTPILLSQTAHALAEDMLSPRRGETRETLHRSRRVLLPGRTGDIRVYPILSDNVDRATRRDPSKTS